MADNHCLRVECLTNPLAYAQQIVSLFGNPVLDQLSEVQNTDMSPKPHILAAMNAESKPVAGAYFLINPQLCSLDINLLIIPPELRGHRLAGRFLYALNDIAELHQLHLMRTTAGFGCTDHMRMYTKLGFQPIPTALLPDAQPYIMQKKIN